MEDKKIPSTLFIRDFPPELAEKCLSKSGETVLTRAVLSILWHYFSLESLYNSEKLKRQDLESDVDLFKSYLRFVDELEKKRKNVLDRISDPNRFYLHDED